MIDDKFLEYMLLLLEELQGQYYDCNSSVYGIELKGKIELLKELQDKYMRIRNIGEYDALDNSDEE